MTTRKQDRQNRRANRKSERQEKRAIKRGEPQAETYYGGTINPAVASAGMGPDWEKKVKMRQHIRKGQDKAARAIGNAALAAAIGKVGGVDTRFIPGSAMLAADINAYSKRAKEKKAQKYTKKYGGKLRSCKCKKK